MLRILFIVLLLGHGFIHLMGFVKAFGFAEITELNQSVSRAQGIMWLLTTLLFVTAGALFLSKYHGWWVPALMAVVLSQCLIIGYWQDAKFGTAANLMVLLIAVMGWGSTQFERTFQTELSHFLRSVESSDINTSVSYDSLPEPVQKWVDFSVPNSQPETRFIQIRQKGAMCLKNGGKWMPFVADQWFDPVDPGFLWKARVGGESWLHFAGRDQFTNGKGKMLIKLYSLIPVVDATGPSIDQGSAVRYLAEMIWLPHAVFAPYIDWIAVDEYKAEALLSIGGLSVKGTFSFDSQGRPVFFEAGRHCDETGRMETWMIAIDTDSYRNFDGLLIPTRAKVTWKLESGDFTWLELEITHWKGL